MGQRTVRKRGAPIRRRAGFQPWWSGHSLHNIVGEPTKKGHDGANLKGRSLLDETKYPKGSKVTDAQPAAINLIPHTFHGNWN
jgi:hypothetical protein